MITMFTQPQDDETTFRSQLALLPQSLTTFLRPILNWALTSSDPHAGCRSQTSTSQCKCPSMYMLCGDKMSIICIPLLDLITSPVNKFRCERNVIFSLHGIDIAPNAVEHDAHRRMRSSYFREPLSSGPCVRSAAQWPPNIPILHGTTCSMSTCG